MAVVREPDPGIGLYETARDIGVLPDPAPDMHRHRDASRDEPSSTTLVTGQSFTRGAILDENGPLGTVASSIRSRALTPLPDRRPAVADHVAC